MAYLVTFIFGISVGAILLGLIFLRWQDRLKQEGKKSQAEMETLRKAGQAIRERQAQLSVETNDLKLYRQAKEDEIRQFREEAIHFRREKEVEIESLIARQQAKLDKLKSSLDNQQAEFNSRVISYNELQGENQILKRDLLNTLFGVQKTQLDVEINRQKQQQIDRRASEIGKRYLSDTVKWIGASLSANNFALSKQRLLDVVEQCRSIGFPITVDEESDLVDNLKASFEKMVRAEIEREEQARIKAQIREEERLRKEIERELAQTEREKIAIQAALDQALAKANDQYSAEVESLRAKLADAEARSQRAISMAQQTKAGNVYVISNIGAFGQGVYKIGMTRRLEPLERVSELSSASVPFPFDVHMMIACTDAPSLENALHRALYKTRRINRVNPRKEFFRSDIETILKVVKDNHGEVEYIADPEALQYNQSVTMSQADADYVEAVYDAAEIAVDGIPAED